MYLRPGNVVIFVNTDGSMAVGLVTSIWKGSTKKKLTVSPCIPENCGGFRAVELKPTCVLQNGHVFYFILLIFLAVMFILFFVFLYI